MSEMHAQKRRVPNKDGVTGHTVCTNCGASVRQRDNYCWHCGAKFYGYERKERSNG